MKNKKGNILLFVVISIILFLTVIIIGWMIVEKKQDFRTQEFVRLNELVQQQELQNKIEQKNQQISDEKKQQDVIANQEMGLSSNAMDQQGKNALIQEAADELNNAKFEVGTKNLKEGEEFDSGEYFGDKMKNECSAGLTPVVAAQEFNGECAFPMCSCYVCTKCGDAICGKGENACNCPSDCKKGEGTKATQEDLYDPQFYSNGE